MFTNKLFLTFTGTLLHWFIGTSTLAQDIAIGTWRLHVSYNSITHITFGNETVFGSTRNGIMVVDLSDKSVSGYNKLTGLSGADISSINYDNSTNQLLISYADGDLDIIKDNVVTNYNSLKNSTAIPGSKRINHINIHNGLAYFATDYGVVVFDLQRQEIKETWRDLGTSGTTLKIIQSTFKGDSIFLATEKGVLAGSLGNNLLDFNNWKRFQQGSFNAPIQSVAFFNGKVYAALTGSGIYCRENSTWIKESFLQNVPIQELSASAGSLLIAQDTRLWKLETSNMLTEITSTLLTRPQDAKLDNNGKIWIGDSQNGLVSDVEGNFTSFILNGPSATEAFRLKAGNNSIIAVSGGYSSNLLPLGNTGDINIFTGAWSSETSPLNDITDVDFRGEVPIASSFGYGVQTGNLAAPDAIYNKDNSTLLASGGAVNITAVENSTEGSWVANYGVDFPLHLLDNNATWQSFSFTSSAAKYPVNLTVDLYRSVWMQLDPARGGGIQVFNRESNRKAYLTEATGAGGLPNRSVNAVTVDRDGFVWVGTNQGVSYFSNPLGVFGSNVDAIMPIFENQYLLSDQRITAIAVDGGNRKWIGTERGVWLFNSTVDEVIYNFTQENSPLLSDVIRDIAINGQTGEVFFATDKGIVSFRSDATESELSFSDVKIFPNPITSDFQGTIGITGLATDAIVKITDVRGKLVWQVQANGGTATWNGNDYNGRKATTGVYLVFSATQDGTESFVGKMVVVK